ILPQPFSSRHSRCAIFFFFIDPSTTAIYTLSLHDALPISSIDTPLHAFTPHAHVDHLHPIAVMAIATAADGPALTRQVYGDDVRSEEHTSELQSRGHLVCRLLLEKKKIETQTRIPHKRYDS